MLNLNHVCKSLGDSQILTDINLSVGSGEVVALIGKNGVGKTTLVNVACGYLIPDSGSVYTDSIACVPQELDKSKSVTDLFSKGVIDWQKQAVLDKVGLKGVNLNDPIDVLSGGQQTRLAFAVALAGDSRPDTLVLDEPTNNLDREMVGWLHDFINDYQGGVLMVSHDRAFINDVATRIIELNSHGIKEYGGNYDFYKNQKKSESFAEMKLYSDYIDEKNKIRNALKKQKSLASGSRKIKTTDNEKMCRDKRAESSQHTFAKRAKAIESRLSQLQKIEKPHSDKSYRVYINGGVHDDKLVLGLTDLDVGYGKCIVAKSINFEIRGPSRTQIMGPNGSGKTTLFRTIMGQMDPIEGDIKVGDGVNAGYFSQDVDSLDHTKNAIYNLSSNGEDRADLRKWLHMLGIQGDDVNKSTGDLSRGQRSKLGIARLLSGNYQLIILDEPTNHLDIATRESIEFSLSKYQGAILFASHDDYFAKKLNPTQLVKLGIN